MPCLRSRFFLFLLKHRHWFRLQARRPVVDWDTSMADLRADVDRAARFFGKVPADIELTSITIGDRPADWLVPAGATKDRAMLYFHGGAYVMGSVEAHRSIVAKFVKASGLAALLFDYRLAPENPFPAALDDALAAYRWLLEQGTPPDRVAFVGDSAGGGLGLATLLAAREQGLPLPAAAVALSPWTDLKLTGASYQRRDPIAPDGSFAVFARHYVGDNDPGLPLISPLYGDLHGLPPLMITVGDDESMFDDSASFAEKAKRSGVDVTLIVGEGMVHCYPAMTPLLPEATAAMSEIAAFLNRHIRT